MLPLFTKTFSLYKKYSSIPDNQDDNDVVNNDDDDVDGDVSNDDDDDEDDVDVDDGDVEQYHGYLPLHAADLLPPTSQSALTSDHPHHHHHRIHELVHDELVPW